MSDAMLCTSQTVFYLILIHQPYEGIMRDFFKITVTRTWNRPGDYVMNYPQGTVSSLYLNRVGLMIKYILNLENTFLLLKI